MQSFQIPSHGHLLNAIAYVAPGVGPHPIVIVLHDFPGNEKNLDLAQSIRRAGWTVIFFDYSGSWGSPGAFTFSNAIEDTTAAIAYLREPVNAAHLRSDPKLIVLVGHSMGGYMAAYAGSHDSAILGIGMISAANFYDLVKDSLQGADDKANVAGLAAAIVKEDILPLAGCTGESVAQEMIARHKEWNFRDYAAIFGARPVLIVTSEDGLAASSIQLAAMLRQQGNKHVTSVHFATDHSYSDHRIALQIEVLNWLATFK